MKKLRLLDANFNRSREALRVLEDGARFILEDSVQAKKIKTLRHDLFNIEKKIFSSNHRTRNSPEDVGRRHAAPLQSKKKSINEVLSANWSRLQESLRSLEEILSIDHPKLSKATEQLRYQTYDLQPLGPRAKQWPLYVLLTEKLSSHSFETLVPQLVQVGVGAIQLREKGLPDKKILARARLIKKLVGTAPISLILNDRPDLAVLAGFHGVHIGQSDISPKQIKKLFGNQLFVGLSTHSVKQASEAQAKGADYIGIGPIYSTQTKPHLKFIGPGEAKKMIRASKPLPHVCIGGITTENAHQIFQVGAKGVAMCTGIIQAKDPKKEAKKVIEVFV